jgi:hypothetical protein
MPSLFRGSPEDNGRQPSTITGFLPGQVHDRQHARCPAPDTPNSTQTFEDSSPRYPYRFTS